MQRRRGPAGEKRHEPLDGRGEEREDRPEEQPDEVRDRKRQTEEDGDAGPPQVLGVTDEVDRMRRRPRQLGEERGRVGVRVAVGDEQDVGEELRLVAEGVAAGIPEPARHPAGRERGEPAEERGDRADPGRLRGRRGVAALAGGTRKAVTGARERRGDCEGGDREDEPEERAPARLRRRLGRQAHVDGVEARLADELGVGVRDEVEVGEDVGRVADVGAEEAVEPTRERACREHGEPARDRREEYRDRPEHEPDQVRDEEQEPEEHRHPAPAEVVGDREAHRMGLVHT